MRHAGLAIALAAAVGCSRESPSEPAPRTEPSVPKPAAARPAAKLGTLSLLIRTDGYVVGDPESGKRVWIPICDDGGYDVAALSTLVCASRTSGYAPRDHVEVAAVGSLPYQTIIEAMDYTIGGGIPNVRIVDPASLPLVSPAEGDIDGASSVPSECGEQAATCLAPALPYELDRNPPADTPLLIVSPDDARLDGVVIAKVSEIAALGEAGRVTALYDALHERPGSALILQADKNLDAQVINRLLMTAYDAGRDNVLFAVNRR